MTKYFEGIEDRRQQGKIKYQLVEVIVITIIAVTAGAEHWNEIAMYCKGKEEMFREKYGLKLENGTPTDDTFQRIFAIIKPDQLEKCFVNWVKSVCKVQENEIVSVDGKTLRGIDDVSIFSESTMTFLRLSQLSLHSYSKEFPSEKVSAIRWTLEFLRYKSSLVHKPFQRVISFNE